MVLDHRVSGDGFIAKVRTRASTRDELAMWLSEFELKTKTLWTVRKTHPGLLNKLFGVPLNLTLL